MAVESYNALLFRFVMLGLVATMVAMVVVTAIWLLIAKRRREVRGFDVKRTGALRAPPGEINDGEGSDQHH